MKATLETRCVECGMVIFMVSTRREVLALGRWDGEDMDTMPVGHALHWTTCLLCEAGVELATVDDWVGFDDSEDASEVC